MLKYALSAMLLFPIADLCAQQQAGTPATAIIGSWRLVSYEDRDSDGVAAYPYGRTPAGMLVYDATGHMAIQIMKQPPPHVASADWDKFTVNERVALYDGYVAYFGRYEVDASRGVVIHYRKPICLGSTSARVRCGTSCWMATASSFPSGGRRVVKTGAV